MANSGCSPEVLMGLGDLKFGGQGGAFGAPHVPERGGESGGLSRMIMQGGAEKACPQRAAPGRQLRPSGRQGCRLAYKVVPVARDPLVPANCVQEAHADAA